MNILLTGKHGQVGFELQRSLALLGHVTAIGRDDIDLSDLNAVRRLIQTLKPDVLVNPAAYTAVDKAETDQAMAYTINADLPKVLAEEAHKLNSLLIHYSTDYVFDGSKNGEYTESDQPKPLSVYGQSKLAGELAIQQTDANFVILRTSWVVGTHGNNFAKTILKLATSKPSLNIVADQIGAPTPASLLADITAHIVKDTTNNKVANATKQIYHVAPTGVTSWYEYAKFLIHQADMLAYPLSLGIDDIHPISTAEYGAPAPRPLNSQMNTDKLCQTFNLKMPTWQSGIQRIVEELIKDKL